MSWSLVLLASPEDLEVRVAELFERGALGVELQEPGMPLMPETPPLPEGRGRAIAHRADYKPDAAPTAGGMGNYIYAAAKGLDGQVWPQR